MSGSQGACPQCGAPLRFGGGQSVATVCTYCRSTVVRRGVAPELIGTVPDLVSTGTQLALGDTGKLGRHSFRVAGRLQLDQGVAVWDEWYLAFDDGSDGWLAEAQGALLATRRAPKCPLPPITTLVPGEVVKLPAIHQDLTVDESGAARFASAAGELPLVPKLGATYRFADLSGPNGEFATIDYGGESRESEDEPILFAGKRLTYAEAGLEAAIASRGRGQVVAPAGPEGSVLSCPNCGAPVPLKRRESESAACASCRSLLDISRGNLAVIGKLGSRTESLIPLGSKGTLQGEQVEVLGYLRRYTQYKDVKYRWSEWQLWSPKGYRWLTEYNGHWLSLHPIPAGEVRGKARDERHLTSGGVDYRHFQTGRAFYEDIQGELSWQANVKRPVTVYDFVTPPGALSCEEDKSEVSWSRGERINPTEIWAAFKLPGQPPRPIGVGMADVNPWVAASRSASRWSLAGVVLLIIAAVFVNATLPGETVARVSVPIANDSVQLSDEFDLIRRQSLAIKAAADVTDAWVGLDIALINLDTGEARTLGLEISRYEGIEDGERWSEGSRSAGTVLGSVAPGRYQLRVEPTVEKQITNPNQPGTANIEAVRGVFVWTPFLLALAALLPGPLITRLLSSSLERRRWAESDHDPGDEQEEDDE